VHTSFQSQNRILAWALRNARGLAAVYVGYWKVAEAVKFWMAANWHVVSSVSLAIQVVVFTTFPPQVTNVEPVFAEAVRVTELPLR
jgi:hypothetical protein